MLRPQAFYDRYVTRGPYEQGFTLAYCRFVTNSFRRPQGRTGSPSRPAVSACPVIRLAFWSACPAAPLPRLSIAPIAITKPVRGLIAYERKAKLDPVAQPVCGPPPACVRRMKGSFA